MNYFTNLEWGIYNATNEKLNANLISNPDIMQAFNQEYISVIKALELGCAFNSQIAKLLMGYENPNNK